MNQAEQPWIPPAGRPARVALVPCAGTGQRAGAAGPKQYAPVAGRSLVHWTLDALLQAPIDRIFVIVSPEDAAFQDAVPAECAGRISLHRAGGATRAATVLAGLALMAQAGVRPHDWVLVHDAARCLIQAPDVQTLIEACDDDPVGGLLALPVPDTLKRASSAARVQATVSREHLWAAQTPQMFRHGLLQSALTGALAAGVAVTDESSAVEWAGHSPRLVTGPTDNIKVTYPADFAVAERILRART